MRNQFAADVRSWLNYALITQLILSHIKNKGALNNTNLSALDLDQRGV